MTHPVSKRFIDECRRRYRDAAAGGGLLALFREPGRTFELDCGADHVPAELAPHYRLLLEHGRVVWAVVAQAEDALYGHGVKDLMANTVYCDDPSSDADLDALRQVARDVFAVKNTKPADPQVAKIAGLITDEQNRALNVPLPDVMTGGRRVLFTTTLVHRRRLPTGYLADAALPIVIAPDMTPWNMLLPLRYWSPGLHGLWLRADERVPEELKQPHERRQVLRPLTAEEYYPTPAVLTRSAAFEVRRVMAEQGVSAGRSCLRVAIQFEPAGFRYLVNLCEEPADREADFVTESHGVRLVVDSRSAGYLAGTEIDFVATAGGRGFVFNNPNAVPAGAEAVTA